MNGLRSLARWRNSRWVLAASFLPLLWACNNRRLVQPDAPPEQETDHYFEQNVNNDIDIVFMIDNSSSMEQEQTNISKNFPKFINVLKSLPAGLPNVHIGVVSSSLGAGGFADVPNCPSAGDRGAFQKTARGMGGCPVPKDNANYLISFKKGTENNFDGDIADAFACIANLGVGGCGFEHQIASVARSLGANLGGWMNGAPGENSGFLRDDAFLAIIFLTDEDDCSAPVDSDLFDTKQNQLSDPLGPLNSFRCNEFGHLCGGQRPPRSPVQSLSDCHSAEDAGKLIKISDFVTFFKTVKKVPNRVIAASIAGQPTPYGVAVAGNGNPQVVPSCTSSNGEAAPGVRIKEFIDAFGSNGTFQSICTDDFAPAMDRIAMEIGKRLGAQCIEGVLVDIDPAMDGTQADCQVVDKTITSSGVVQTPLPNCMVGGGGGQACWRLQANARECTVSGFELKIDRGSQMAPPNTVTSVKCATCINPETDPRCKGGASP